MGDERPIASIRATLLCKKTTVFAQMQTTEHPTDFWKKFWWLPILVVVVGVSIGAVVLRYEPPDYRKIVDHQTRSISSLEGAASTLPPVKALRYARRSILVTQRGSNEVVGKSTVTPLGGGWLLREDDWYDKHGQALLYQERHVMYRGLFAVHSQYREIVPFLHQLFGSLGWRGDETVSQTATGKLPTGEVNEIVTVSQSNRTNIDWTTMGTVPLTDYQKSISCRPVGLISGSEIHGSVRGQHQLVACVISPPGQTRGLAYVSEFGMYFPMELKSKDPAAPLAFKTYDSIELLRE